MLLYRFNFHFKIWLRAREVAGSFEKRAIEAGGRENLETSLPMLSCSLRAHVVWRKRPRRILKAVFYCWSANTYRLNHLVCRRRFQNFDGGSGFACGKECGWNSLQFEFCPSCQNSGAWPSHETNREKLMIGPKTFSYEKVSLDLPACYHEKKFLQCSSLACRLQKIAEVLNYSLHRT